MSTEDKNIIGTGAILRNDAGIYFLQERDHNAPRNPGRIAPFGGGLEEGEDDVSCIVREIKEELDFDVKSDDLMRIGLFESHTVPGAWLSLFLISGVDGDSLKLSEGEAIVELNLTEAFEDKLVTDFTKRALKVVCEKGL